MAMMARRPALKRQLELDLSPAASNPFPFATCSTVLQSPHVHFPPTPTLTSTYHTHSAETYDRAPIDVAPNSCALPRRGGRVYIQTCEAHYGMPSDDSLDEVNGSYFHARAFEACEIEPPNLPSISFDTPGLFIIQGCPTPPETIESDELAETRPDPEPMPPVPIPLARNPSMPRNCSQDGLERAFAFLPYPPSEKEKKYRRKSSPSTAGYRLPRRDSFQSNSSFVAPTLDGCLGGF